MKKWMLAGLFSSLVTCAWAQIITVKNADTGQPIELATLSSENPREFAMTNAEGQANFSMFEGAEVIEIRMVGYETLTMSFEAIRRQDFLILLPPMQISLDQVVVSATRWSQSKRKVPARISTIDAREIALQNPQTAADLLGGSGEVFVQKSQQGGGSPMIRGFSTNRLLYAVDGIRMNTAIFRSGNLQNVISLDPFAMESAEVLFGPGSILYGSDAIGGVMSFQTLQPEFSTRKTPLISGKAVARYASANEEQTVHFDVQTGWKKWAFATSFSSNDFGDLRMGTDGPEEYLRPFYVQRINNEDVVIANDDPLIQRPNAFSVIHLLQKVRFQPNPEWDLQYGFHYSTTTRYDRYDRHVRLRDGLPRSGEWYYGPQEWMLNHLTATHQGGTAIYDQMSIRLAHQLFGESRYDRNFGGTDRSGRVEKVNALSANVDFLKEAGQRSTLFYGLEAVFNEVASSGTQEDILTGKTEVGPSRYPQSTWSTYAAYLTYQLEVTEAILLQAGARYSHFVLEADFSNNLAFFPFPTAEASIENGAFTGSLGVVYNPSDKWSISANASTGFRAPNVDDIGKVFDSEPGAVVVPNPDLQAEYAYNGEISLTRVFGKRIKVDLAAYYTFLDNALVRRNFTLNGQDSILYDGEMSRVQAIQNAAQAYVYGLEAGLEVKFPGGFSLDSRLNVQYGEEELDDGVVSPSRHAAPWFGMTRLNYKADRLLLQLDATYSGSKDFDELAPEEQGKPYLYAIDANGNPWSPGWYTLNIRAMHQLSDQLSVTAGVENLTDQRYRTYSSGLAAAGRNLILSLRMNF